MTTYTVKGPSGKTYTLEGPDGATADQLGQAILANSKDERVASETAREKAQYDPTNDMGTGERVLAGIGRGMSSIGRGLGGLVGLTSDEDVADAKRTDAPLLATTAGKAGNLIGQAAAVAPGVLAAPALAPALGTYGAAATIGGATGALTTEGGLKDRALGAAGGAVGGAVGQGIGQGLAAGAGAAKTAISNYIAKSAPSRAAVQAAQDAGYALPPVQVAPTVLNGLAQMWGGPIKTTQAAAAKNQGVTDALAAKALGLPTDRPITTAALDAVRANAGQAYDAVKSAGTITATPAYDAALDKISAPFVKASQGFPNAKVNPIVETIDSLRSKAFDAASAVAKTQELRADATKAFAQGDKTTGNALKAASNAIEDQIDQHLVASGAPADTLQAFRDARTLIAKSYDVQKALKGDHVSAATLAATQGRTGRLTGDLATIADAGARFPKATALLREEPSPFSAVDGFGGLSSLALHNPAAIAAIAARPAVRSAVLSGPGQAVARFQPGPTVANALALALQNPATRRAALLGGMAAGSNLIGANAQ